MVKVGDEAPRSEVVSMSGERVDVLSSLAHHKALVLVFYLLDFSGV
ncbi:MAG: hypothetical protein ABR507_12260 [Actinomycetota bacterium]|nr:hypothetical protein [Actinomycetota bacterium]